MNTAAQIDRLAPLREFVLAMGRLLDEAPPEERLLAVGRELMARLVAADNWLPEAFAQPSPQRYQQYLLHCDPQERFSVVSFVWGPGQRTPVHDHGVWGLIGMLRGIERSTPYVRTESGLAAGAPQLLQAGEVEAVSPRIGDIHEVANALADRPSISIHAYGANIGRHRRHVFDPATGAAKAFISGYAAEVVPNLWQGPTA
jgi:predicted metal-dependent enzyme (double-stranded beta helix superfamily)